MATRLLPRFVLSSLAATSAIILASCAGGPTYAEQKNNLPPIPANKGRVFVYRPQPFAAAGAAIRPQVRIDGQSVGTSKSGGFLYSDQSPGVRTVSLTTETTKQTSVEIQSGKPSFVECSLEMGVLVGRIKPIQVTTATGEANIQNCRFTAE